MSDEFKWDEDSLVFPSVFAVAVYKNPYGNLVIRQRPDEPQMEDVLIYIPIDRVKHLIAALKKAAKED